MFSPVDICSLSLKFSYIFFIKNIDRNTSNSCSSVIIFSSFYCNCLFSSSIFYLRSIFSFCSSFSFWFCSLIILSSFSRSYLFNYSIFYINRMLLSCSLFYWFLLVVFDWSSVGDFMISSLFYLFIIEITI